MSWLFPFDDVVVRATGVLLLAAAVLSAVPLARDLLERSQTAGLHAVSSAALVAAIAVVRCGTGSPERALVGVAVLVDVAAVLFGLSSAVAESSWCLLLPMVFVQVVALCALALPDWVLWLQVGFGSVASGGIVGVSRRAWWGVPHENVNLAAGSLLVAVTLVAVAWGIRGLAGQLRSATAAAENRSLSDPLTGALNRRGLESSIGELVGAARRAGEDLTVAVADLDHFKRVNDVHGHATGDAVLTATARALRAGLRAEDLVARFGGEEFVIVVRTGRASGEARGVAAWGLAERVRAVVSRANAVLGVTVSVGAVQREAPAGGADPVSWLHEVVSTADDRLYVAKREGRDRSVVDPPPPEAVSTMARVVPREILGGADQVTDAGRGEHRRRRASDRRRAASRVGWLLSRLDAVVLRVFPTDSVVMRAVAAFCLLLAPLVSFTFVLSTIRDAAQGLQESSWWTPLVAAAALALWSRRDLSRVFTAIMVLLVLAAMVFGLMETVRPPPDAARLAPMLQLFLVSFVATTMSARVLWWLIAVVAAVTAIQSGLLTADPLPLAAVEVVTSAGFVLLVFITSVGSIRLLLGRLRVALAEAEWRADRDPLTGVANRRGLERRITDLLGQARTSGRGVLVLVADLDHFKQVNDTHGHAVGDLVLKATAGALHATASDGLVARFGGEEDELLTAVEGEGGARAVAERLRQDVKAANAGLGVTVSVGGILRPLPPPGDDAVAWLHRIVDDADDLLYTAKRGGRDRCVVSTGTPTAPPGVCEPPMAVTRAHSS